MSTCGKIKEIELLNKEEKVEMVPDEVYKELDFKILTIQLQAALYEKIIYSDVGKKIWEKFEKTTIGNVHLVIQNALQAALSIEITKLFDPNEDSIWGMTSNGTKSYSKGSTSSQEKFPCFLGSRLFYGILFFLGKKETY